MAYVSETYPPEVNGVSLTVGRTVDWLRRRGHHVQLTRPRRPGEALGPGADGLVWHSHGAAIPQYPDLRFGWDSAAALARHYASAGVRQVHLATPGPLAWNALHAARRLGLPVTSDFRTNFHRYSGFYGLRWLSPLVLAALRRLHNAGVRTFVPTEALRAELAALGFARLSVVARGIDTVAYTPTERSAALRAQWGAADDRTPVLLHVGRLAPEKNVALALAAHAAVRQDRPDVRMVVVGDGPSGARLRGAHPDVYFAGMQHGSALAAHYASADVFLFPSLSDTFGNVTLEAMASGLAVVAFDAAAAAACIESGTSGVLVPPGDDAAYVDAVRRLVVGDAWSPMGNAARSAMAHHGWDSVLTAFETELAECAGLRGA